VPIADVSVNYGVSAGDLDLASNAGAAELSKRVSDAAQAACKKLSRQYPDATPDDAECVKRAVDEAMIKVRKMAAAAQRKNGLTSADQRSGQTF
jgi:UrcA family protein